MPAACCWGFNSSTEQQSWPGHVWTCLTPILVVQCSEMTWRGSSALWSCTPFEPQLAATPALQMSLSTRGDKHLSLCDLTKPAFSPELPPPPPSYFFSVSIDCLHKPLLHPELLEANEQRRSWSTTWWHGAGDTREPPHPPPLPSRHTPPTRLLSVGQWWQIYCILNDSYSSPLLTTLQLLSVACIYFSPFQAMVSNYRRGGHFRPMKPPKSGPQLFIFWFDL